MGVNKKMKGLPYPEFLEEGTVFICVEKDDMIFDFMETLEVITMSDGVKRFSSTRPNGGNGGVFGGDVALNTMYTTFVVIEKGDLWE